MLFLILSIILILLFLIFRQRTNIKQLYFDLVAILSIKKINKKITTQYKDIIINLRVINYYIYKFY